MKKAAGVIALMLLWVLGAGCASQATKARVRMRVFDMPTQALRRGLPDQKPHRLADSAYCVSVVSPDQLNAMLLSNNPRPWTLADRTRVINDWPSTTDTWAYAPNQEAVRAGALYTGGGVGALGVGTHGQHLTVHVDYMVSHRSPRGEQLVDSQFYYENDYPEGQVLLFYTPSDTSGAGARYQVIAFEFTRAPQASDILAYR
jgi:hypothetical protein